MGRNVLEKQGDKPHQNRKSKKMPKRLVLDGLDDDEDDEIRYLEKLKTSKVAGYKDLGEESTKTRSLSRVLKVDKYEILDDVGRSGKEVERISDRSSEYTDYEEDSPETPAETKREVSLTTRQRALLSSRDTSATSANQIEFPNGLPPPPPRSEKILYLLISCDVIFFLITFSDSQNLYCHLCFFNRTKGEANSS